MRSKRHLYNSYLSFIDLLINMTVGFAALFFICFLMINIDAKQEGLKPPTQFIIQMSWPDFDRNDIDLWVLTPDLNKVGYSNREGGYVFLDRDDLGTNNYAEVNGVKTEIGPRVEVVSVRARQDGHYVVNSYLYFRRIPRDPNAPDRGLDGTQQEVSQLPPVPVKIQLIEINPNYRILAVREFMLATQGDEYTALQFDIVNGEIVNVTEQQFPFIKKGLSDSIFSNEGVR